MEALERMIDEMRVSADTTRDTLLARFETLEQHLRRSSRRNRTSDPNHHSRGEGSRSRRGSTSSEGGSTGSEESPPRSRGHRSRDRWNERRQRREQSREQWRKLDLPLFSGDEAFAWVDRLERFFEVRGVPIDERMNVAVVALEGQALAWYRWWVTSIPHPTWPLFKEDVVRRFQPEMVENPFELLLSLKQTGSVREYREKFEVYSGPLRISERRYLLGVFLNGLKRNIRAETKLHRPETLAEMFMVAEMVEKRIRAEEEAQGELASGSRGEATGVRNSSWDRTYGGERSKGMVRVVTPPGSNPLSSRGSGGGGIGARTGSQLGGNTLAATSSHSVNRASVGTNRVRNFRNLPEEEYREKVRRGLCFYCDEKFGPNHVCKNRQFRLMLVEEVDEGVEDEEEGVEGKEWVGELPQIDFNRLTTQKAMRLWGVVNGVQTKVLIDSGASHNFISPKLVQEVGLTIKNNEGCWVKVGDGYQIRSEGVCWDVPIQLQGVEFRLKFFLFPLDDIDVVLGWDWLEGLGEVKTDYKNFTMKIKQAGQKWTLQGCKELESTSHSLGLIGATTGVSGERGLVRYWLLEESDANPVASNPVMEGILQEFGDRFEEPKGLPPPRHHDHSIVLKEGSNIPNLRPYRYPHYQKAEIERLVGEMLTAGIIRASVSPYSSPVILVKKKDGGWRFCVDFRALNLITVPNKFPIPVIDELLDELAGATIFSKLDLKSGYHQIRMRAEDIEKTAFRTHEGHYEFLVMPFGLTNAPSTFQALMNEVLRPYLRRFVLVFFDDILIYSVNEEKHKVHLRAVLELLRKHQLVVNKKKCCFMVREVEYLGHIISGQGVAADPQKVAAMVQWPSPKDVKGLRGFLGLTGYYRRFVRNYGVIAKPLTELLKKDQFLWSETAQVAFEELKQAMISLPILAVPDFSQPFIVETDASSKGLGAVLSQSGRPIAFFSQSLSFRAQSKSVYERELMAIVFAVQKWRHYLMGGHFIIRTDQRSLKYLTEQRLLGEDQAKWTTKLMGLDFEIQYKPGHQNKAADALSRQMTFNAMSVIQSPVWEQVDTAVQHDEQLNRIKLEVLQQHDSHPGFSVYRGRLYYEGRIVIPKGSDLIPTLIAEFHSSNVGGHSGLLRTYKRMAAVVYWRGMMRDIQDFISKCDTCQRNKYLTLAPAGLLQPLPVPQRVWDEVSMDFITGLPRAHGKDTILVVVDRFTKYAHFLALSHPFSAKDVAQLFIDHVVKLHGFPQSIVSDRDQLFMSNFWSELLRQSGTKLKFSTAYHPQTDGQSEVVNRCLETYLRCFCGDKPFYWPKWLAWAEYWFNTSYNASSNMTPFKALYGRDPPVLFRGDTYPCRVPEVQAMTQERDLLLDSLRQNLLKAQQRMKTQADKGRREVQFQIGDWVYLKVQPYRFKSLARKRNEKLSPRFYGPYQILEKIGAVAYKLQLPDSCRIHPVFHVALLKKATPPSVAPQDIPPLMQPDWELKAEPADVLALRYDSSGEAEVLVHWHGLPRSEDSWERLSALADLFPDFPLEDKAKLLGGSIDRPLLKKVFVRRGLRGPIEETGPSSGPN